MSALARAALALAAACLAFAAAAATPADPIPVPKIGRVVDQTGTLTQPERAALEAKLYGFERERGSQVAVLIVPSIGPETIEEFAGRVTDAWKLGRKGLDDGVLFVVAKQERKLRIHTGRGVQGTLTDALSKRIVADQVSPRFRAGDFAGGINAGVDSIFKAILGEALPAPAERAQPRTGKVDTMSNVGNLAVFGLVLVPVAGMVLRSMFGRFFGATATAGVTGVAAWFLIGSLLVVGVAAILAFLFTLLAGMSLPRTAGRGGWGGGWSTGGGSWGGGSGGGGGFGGGGGGFDGGGASGDW